MNSKGMFYTNVSDYETKEDMMNDFIALRMYDMAKDKEIARLTAESTKWESKFYDEAKKVDKAIEYIENKNKYLDSENYYQVFEYRDIYLIPLLDILKGIDKE